MKGTVSGVDALFAGFVFWCILHQTIIRVSQSCHRGHDVVQKMRIFRTYTVQTRLKDLLMVPPKKTHDFRIREKILSH